MRSIAGPAGGGARSQAAGPTSFSGRRKPRPCAVRPAMDCFASLAMRGNPSAMNYRHAFHAGGFADVLKHIVLTRILLYLQEKPAAFRAIDTHAGAGLYALSGGEG